MPASSEIAPNKVVLTISTHTEENTYYNKRIIIKKNVHIHMNIPLSSSGSVCMSGEATLKSDLGWDRAEAMITASHPTPYTTQKQYKKQQNIITQNTHIHICNRCSGSILTKLIPYEIRRPSWMSTGSCEAKRPMEVSSPSSEGCVIMFESNRKSKLLRTFLMSGGSSRSYR